MKLLSFIKNIILYLGTTCLISLGILFIYINKPYFYFAKKDLFWGGVFFIIILSAAYFFTENNTLAAIRLRKIFFIFYSVFFICIGFFSFLGFKKNLGFNFFISTVTDGILKSVSAENRRILLPHISR